MKLYLVMKAVSSMAVAGQSCNLPDGEYAIPAFADFKKAEEHANNGNLTGLLMKTAFAKTFKEKNT